MSRNHYHEVHPETTVSACLLDYLELEGVTRLFGIPGAGIKHILKELKDRRDEFEYVICRQETGAAYIADGYARATGEVGVVLVTSGPGATNALTGAMSAQSNNVSMLVITGEVPSGTFGKGYVQEGIDSKLNVDAIYSNASQYSAVVTSPENFQTLFAQALRDARSKPARTSHISIPEDVAEQPLKDVVFPKTPANYRAVPECCDPERTQQAFDLLTAAERPILFLGSGCFAALADDDRRGRLLRMVERYALPVVSTPDGKGVFPESHRLSLRNFGLAACNWPQYYLDPSQLDPKLPKGYDALMVLGSSLGEFATSKWNPLLMPDGPIIQVDLDQSVIGRTYPIAVGIVADIGRVLDDLIRFSEAAEPNPGRKEARLELIDRIKSTVSAHAHPEQRASDASPIEPAALVRVINDLIPPGSHIAVDAGNCVGWALHHLVVDHPTRAHISLAMGAMGFGVGAVLGAKLGAPKSTCVGIVGDGAFLMHGAEVSTAARYRAGAIWVVLSDNELQMVNQGMNHFYADPVWKEYYQLGEPDLVKFAESLGANAYGVHSPAELVKAFGDAIARADSAKQPQVIVAFINKDSMPPYYQPAKPAP